MGGNDEKRIPLRIKDAKGQAKKVFSTYRDPQLSLLEIKK